MWCLNCEGGAFLKRGLNLWKRKAPYTCAIDWNVSNLFICWLPFCFLMFDGRKGCSVCDFHECLPWLRQWLELKIWLVMTPCFHSSALVHQFSIARPRYYLISQWYLPWSWFQYHSSLCCSITLNCIWSRLPPPPVIKNLSKVNHVGIAYHNITAEFIYLNTLLFDIAFIFILWSFKPCFAGCHSYHVSLLSTNCSRIQQFNDELKNKSDWLVVRVCVSSRVFIYFLLTNRKSFGIKCWLKSTKCQIKSAWRWDNNAKCGFSVQASGGIWSWRWTSCGDIVVLEVG